MYSNSTCRVLHKGKISNPIEIKSGVRQGCVLSPLLFLVVIDTVMRIVNLAQRGIQWNLTRRLEDLDYADDLCILAQSLNDIQMKLNELQSISERAGLKINIQKTKEMRIHNSNTHALLLQDAPIERTSKFCYLGSYVTESGGADVDIMTRIRKAKQAFAALNKFWSSTYISKKTKLRVFNTNVKSVLLYASETWLVNEALTSKLQTFINKCLRKIMGIYWPNIISNQELWRITGQKEIKYDIKMRKWKWIGHILRRDSANIAREALNWNPQGKRKVGRPKNTWRRSIQNELKGVGKSWNEAKAIALNRTRWRCFIEALCST